MAIKIINPPESEPLTVVEVKTYLRIDSADNDAILTSLITQAREFCEDYQSKKYITQTLELVLGGFPYENYIEFRGCSPVQKITSIKYYGTDGTENVFSSDNYMLDNDSFVNRVVLKHLKSWSASQLQPVNGVRINFDAGYGEAVAVPESVKQAMVLHIKLLYDDYRPDERKALENTRNALLGMRRVIQV